MKNAILDAIELIKEVFVFALCFGAFGMIFLAPYIFPAAFGG